MWLWWLTAGVVGAVVVVDWLLRRFAICRIADIFENVPPFNVVPEAEVPQAQPLMIRTSDGLQLSGSLQYPERERPLGLVIFFPELSGNHWMARRYCEALLAEGFAILAFDFRNQGHSQHQPDYAPIHWITEYEMTDVAAVLEYVESHPELSTMSLFAFGVSRGGVAALIAGSRYPRFRAVIADSAFGTMPMAQHFVNRFVSFVIPGWLYALLPTWHIQRSLRQGLQLSEARRRCRYVHLENEVDGLADTPVLLISGKRDSYVSTEVAQRLQELIGDTAELWMVDQAKHNMARAVATADYDGRITQHFLSALAVPVPQRTAAARTATVSRSLTARDAHSLRSADLPQHAAPNSQFLPALTGGQFPSGTVSHDNQARRSVEMVSATFSE